MIAISANDTHFSKAKPKNVYDIKKNVKIAASALENIRNEKMAALTELKNEVGQLSLEIAKRILQRELTDPKKQEEYARQLLSEINFN